jgi:glutathione S-transferase
MAATAAASAAAAAVKQPVTLFLDLMSQPCRAVYMFVKAAGIPHIVSPVIIHKGQMRSPEFLAVNPLGQLPAMREADGYTLTER